MASCETKVFDVTPAQFDEARQKLAAQHIHIDGDKGVAIEHGITFNFEFQRDNSKLFVTIPSHPFIFPCSKIFDEFDKAFA